MTFLKGLVVSSRKPNTPLNFGSEYFLNCTHGIPVNFFFFHIVNRFIYLFICLLAFLPVLSALRRLLHCITEPVGSTIEISTVRSSMGGTPR